MAAIAYPMNDPWVAGRPMRPGRPALPDARVYRRRRAVALLALAAVALTAVAAFRLALVGSGGGALTTSGSSGAAGAAATAGRVYVVQPGDSLWSIVVASGHRGDPRPVVDRLALRLNGRPIHPGQRLRLP